MFNMMWHVIILPVLFSAMLVTGNRTNFHREDQEERRSIFLAQLISFNLRKNGWSNIMFAGRDFSDSFYIKMMHIPYTFTSIQVNKQYVHLENVVPYSTNVLVMHCANFEEFEQTLRKVLGSPYWHPLANIILYYHVKEQEDIPKIFMIFWFYRAANVILLQNDNDEEIMKITYYNVYVSEHYKLSRQFGCWKSSKIGRVVRKFRDSFKCEVGCHNATLMNSVLRTEHLGSCIGMETLDMKYDDVAYLKTVNLFEDKGVNLHGHVMAGRSAEVSPFLYIKKNQDGGYTLGARDGLIWSTIAEIMNFTMDFSWSNDYLDAPFNFEVNVQQIFSMARRQADVVVFPIYQFDIVVAELDFSIPYKDSGVCIMSHRAAYETVLFDVKLLQQNIDLVIKFIFCVTLIWVLFFLFNSLESKKPSFDQAGKDLVNTIRNILSISLHKPPKNGAFRIYLVISIWCFFLVNFATQAAIISFFSAYKRGKDVDTFEDVIEKGYVVEGMASPDMILPDTEERFRKINSKLVYLSNMYECVDRLSNDSQRFCLIDCSLGRYLARNKLNQDGEQYIHIARDRIHSHYLVMALHKHSPLTHTYNKYLRKLIEGGLIIKWEQYRFNDITSEAPVKALSLEDLIGIVKCYHLLLGLSSMVFILEIFVGFVKRTIKYMTKKSSDWKKTRQTRKQLDAEKNIGRFKRIDAVTQTF